MLGNKCDLDTKRVVETGDGQRLADSQDIAFMETSAKSNVNISEAFSTMAQIILEKVREGRGLFSSGTSIHLLPDYHELLWVGGWL